jgi:general secretion pathway protein E
MILELLPVSDAIRTLVLRHAEARELLAEAVRAGMQTMAENGVAKALAGITTIDEVARVIRES